MTQVTVKISCNIGWRLFKEYDNSNNTNTTIRCTVDASKSKVIKGITFTTAVNKSSREEAKKLNLSVTASATWVPVSATISASLDASNLLMRFVTSIPEVTRGEVSKWEETESLVCIIGPNDKLYFYQQIFEGPGLHFTLDTISATNEKKKTDDIKTIEVEVVSECIRFIKSIDVAYGDYETHAPEDRIRDFWGKSDDINAKHKGKYVWMIPRWTNDISEAATSFGIRIQGNAVDGWNDLAKGAGGDFRYVISNHSPHTERKVRAAKLLRSAVGLGISSMIELLGKGWTACPRDINASRGGDYLYLAWELY